METGRRFYGCGVGCCIAYDFVDHDQWMLVAMSPGLYIDSM